MNSFGMRVRALALSLPLLCAAAVLPRAAYSQTAAGDGTAAASLPEAALPAGSADASDSQPGLHQPVPGEIRTMLPEPGQERAAGTDPAAKSSPIATSGALERPQGVPLKVEEIREAPATVSSIDLTQQPADLWDRIRAGFAMSDLHSPQVLDRQAWYASRPEQIKVMVERSRRYLFHIVEELERRGMPTELALLPMVESAFNPMAYSRAQASGLWQFIPSTGKNYRLDQNWWYDGRRDIVASTAAALDYLQTIYEMNGDWHLALASYNWGENAVARAIERNRKRGLPVDYSSLQMPKETRYYVPKLQALKNIVMNPAAFGIELEPIPNAPYFATVQLNRDIDLELAARFADMPVEELIALNPGHNRPVVSSSQSVSLVLPADRLESFLENVADHNTPFTSWQTYAAKRGERVDHIAAAHGTTVEQLRQVNGIRGSGRLQNDVELLVPASAEAQLPEGLFKAPATIWAEPETTRIAYTVDKKDTWASIARKLRVRTADLQRWNGGTKLVAGHKLVAYRREGAGVRLVATSVGVHPHNAHATPARAPAKPAAHPAPAVKKAQPAPAKP
jgi:membrane-bound lytic murein transglycosylase D